MVPEGESQKKQFNTQPCDPRNGDRQVWKRCWDPGQRIWGIPFFSGMIRTSHTSVKEDVPIDFFFSFSLFFFPGEESGKCWALLLNIDFPPFGGCWVIPHNSLTVLPPPPDGIPTFVAQSRLPVLPKFPQAAKTRDGVKAESGLAPAAPAPPCAEPVGICCHSQMSFPAGGAGRAGNDSALAQSQSFQHPQLDCSLFSHFPPPFFNAVPAQQSRIAFPADVQNPGEEVALECEGKGRAGNIPVAREAPGCCPGRAATTGRKSRVGFCKGMSGSSSAQLFRDHGSGVGWAGREGQK